MTDLDMKGLEALLPCRCGGAAELVDDRVVWFVRCNVCKPATVVYGDNVRHLDHITADTDEESDRLSSEAFAAVDWDALKQSAITAWNRLAATPTNGDDLVERLKAGAMELNHKQGVNADSTIFGKAAARILALEAQVTRKQDLFETLVSFVHRWTWGKDGNGTSDAERLDVIKHYPPIAARKALEPTHE